jgi:hypothetical protein
LNILLLLAAAVVVLGMAAAAVLVDIGLPRDIQLPPVQQIPLQSALAVVVGLEQDQAPPDQRAMILSLAP